MLDKLHGVALIALFAFALAATAFAHHMPNAADLDLETYVLAGGSVSDICAEDGAEGKASRGKCPACHIVGSAMIPDAPQSLVAADRLFVAAVIAPRENRAVRSVLDPAHGTRAPPLA